MKLQLWLCVLRERPLESFLHSNQLIGLAVHLSQTQHHCYKVNQITTIAHEENQKLFSIYFITCLPYRQMYQIKVRDLNRTYILYHAIIFSMMSLIFRDFMKFDFNSWRKWDYACVHDRYICPTLLLWLSKPNLTEICQVLRRCHLNTDRCDLPLRARFMHKNTYESCYRVLQECTQKYCLRFRLPWCHSLPVRATQYSWVLLKALWVSRPSATDADVPTLLLSDVSLRPPPRHY